MQLNPVPDPPSPRETQCWAHQLMWVSFYPREWSAFSGTSTPETSKTDTCPRSGSGRVGSTLCSAGIHSSELSMTADSIAPVPPRSNWYSITLSDRVSEADSQGIASF